MVTIYKNGIEVSATKGLRGILDYARKHGIDAVGVSRHMHDAGAMLNITFKDRARASVEFADHGALISWLSSRRSWPENYRNW